MSLTKFNGVSKLSKLHLFKLIALLASAVMFTATASQAQELPTDANWTQWFKLVSHLESGLEQGDARWTLALKKLGGTSCYALVVQDGKTIGALLPENSATS